MSKENSQAKQTRDERNRKGHLCDRCPKSQDAIRGRTVAECSKENPDTVWGENVIVECTAYPKTGLDNPQKT